MIYTSSDENVIESFNNCPARLVVETKQVCDPYVNGYLNFKTNEKLVRPN